MEHLDEVWSTHPWNYWELKRSLWATGVCNMTHDGWNVHRVQGRGRVDS